MAIRTTNSAVRKLVEAKDTVSMTQFIEAANALVDDVCVPLEYSDTRLELIERWLAAHFYAIFNGVLAAEKVDELSRNFQYKVDKYLDFTKYGQQAIALDTKGGLRAWQMDMLKTDVTRVVQRQLVWGGSETSTKDLTEY